MRWIAAAIVIAGALVAASVALTSRYSITGTGNQLFVFRLNNWTGEVALCRTSDLLHGVIDCRVTMTDAEVGLKGDWVPVLKDTDQFGGVRVPEAKAK